jgi:hypothetical protein
MTIPEATLAAGHETIRIRGRDTHVPAVRIHERTTIVTGRWIKLARIMDEELVEGEPVAHPAGFISLLRESALGADLFTFAERPPQTTPRQAFHVEWDNWAVVPTNSFKDWWEKRLPQESRKNVRRAGKRGVTVRSVPFDDELVAGIHRIYNETPVRQGRAFWHYGKGLEAVKRENVTYLERSEFIGAYFQDQLIGFIKIIYVDHVAMLIQILAMNEHHDKRPMNALLAHAVQVCVQRKAAFLVYGNYVYGNKTDSSLLEFKRRNGFEELRFPRYYVPLNTRGKLALRSGLHHGATALIPRGAQESLLKCRAQFYRLWHRPSKATTEWHHKPIEG